jgi:hypothetical protein
MWRINIKHIAVMTRISSKPGVSSPGSLNTYKSK